MIYRTSDMPAGYESGHRTARLTHRTNWMYRRPNENAFLRRPVAYTRLPRRPPRSARMTLTQLRYLIAIADSGLNITLAAERVHATQPGLRDRKSTRLNSSHMSISY